MDDELNTVIEKFKCILEAEIDTSQPNDLLAKEVDVDKLKAASAYVVSNCG